jgi:hypothetical protein
MSTKINKSGYWQWAKFFRKAQIVIRFLSLLVSMKESFNKIVDEPSYLPVFSTSPSPCPLPSRGGGVVGCTLSTPGFAGGYQYIAHNRAGSICDVKKITSRHISGLGQRGSHL